MAHGDTNVLLLHTELSSPLLALPVATPGLRERDRLMRRAKALSWLSLAYMTAEDAIAITAAVTAGTRVGLWPFGL